MHPMTVRGEKVQRMDAEEFATALEDLVRSYGAGGDVQWDTATPLERDLLATVRSETLNTLVQSALDLRNQGRIDQSIPLLTKANRQQLDAIEAIQGAFDALRGQGGMAVVFAKYRQFHPFEMGIENGGDVLALLEDFAHRGAAESDERRARLHELETQRRDECERLEFFERRFGDGSEDDAIAEMRAAIEVMDQELHSVKYRILEDVLYSVDALLREIADQAERDRLILSLSKWLYVLVTSPTATRLADDVRTEV